ncbi:MAG: hypothetical protein DRQ47_07490 [Gammaproteobacteria bacterium]|nr:MAG: hypothetical protein DRQ47_07490 [Gammaproteobacteria bacterium]
MKTTIIVTCDTSAQLISALSTLMSQVTSGVIESTATSMLSKSGSSPSLAIAPSTYAAPPAPVAAGDTNGVITSKVSYSLQIREEN